MSCSAKLPVYIILAGAFFGSEAGSVIFVIYLLGIVLSIVTGRIFRSTLFKGADAPFVMELPPYRVPMLKSLMIHMWDRSKLFLKRMGGIILIGSIVVWALANFPRVDLSEHQSTAGQTSTQKGAPAAQADLPPSPVSQEKQLRELQASRSVLGHLGRFIAPVFEPIGIDWRGGIALVSGFVAKEIVVSTLAVLHAVTDEQEGDALQKALLASGMTPHSALSMMVFVLLYLPCLATVVAIRRESGSTKWMLLSIGYNTAVAWLAAFGVYQGGRLIF
jgi:ferrous iron transport protein B